MFVLRVLVVFVVFNAIIAQPIGNDDTNEVVKPKVTLSHNDLWKDAKSFKCKPQQRSFLVQDLLKKANVLLETTEKIPVLTSIVLYRCDQQSGCCTQPPGQVCAELESEEVVLQFRATKPDGSYRHIEIDEFNHTKCACQNITEIKRNDANDNPIVHSLTSAGVANRHEYKLVLCVASLLYFIYLL